ncbi:UTP--glucose-1-phosphate uridylyltransferase [Candidatus Dependentiae bacterium]|nr:UTP--glucose-1-phosphate uridylyltransferase [Candidatus Dependentiae bacterium]
MNINKVIIPAAGLGTRFLPFTKAVPKELLPIMEKPAIQFIIEEGLNSEISDFLFITNHFKSAIADHFENNFILDHFIKDKKKLNSLLNLERISKLANFAYLRQAEPLGLGHAILQAKNVISKEYFAVALPDDLIFGQKAALAQLISVAKQEKASVIAVQEVPNEKISSYGVVAIKKQITPNLFQVSKLVEKPQPKDAPSNLAIIGRYILSSKIMDSLEEISRFSTSSELQLTDGIDHMLKNGEKVFAYKIQGTRHDVGNPLGWLKAVIDYGLQNTEYEENIRAYLAEINL